MQLNGCPRGTHLQSSVLLRLELPHVLLVLTTWDENLRKTCQCFQSLQSSNNNNSVTGLTTSVYLLSAYFVPGTILRDFVR